MVNKIDGNNYHVYTNPKKVNIPDSDEKFSLDYEKEESQAGLKDNKLAAEQNGVRIEISGKGIEQQKQAETPEQQNESGTTSLLNTIRTFLTAAITAVKDIFSKIWSNPIPEDAVTDTPENIDYAGIAGDTEPPEAENSEHEIQKHLQNGDMEQVIRILTDNGRKTPARNSTLLTSYDKNGRMVELDASIRQRTLYGDRNTRKL